jgi:hypothetical protein
MQFPQLPGETSSLKTLCQNETYFVKKNPKTFFHAVITPLRPHNLALFQSEDFPKTVLWGSRFRSNPKTFPSTAGSQRSVVPSRKRGLSIASCLEMCVIMPYCMSTTSPFDHVPIRRPSHDRQAKPVLPVQSEDLPFRTRQSAISFPLPKDWALDRFMPSICIPFGPFRISTTSPFDHVPIRRPSHNRPARLVLPIQSGDLPFRTRQSAISFPLPKDWALDRFMPLKCP